MKKFFALLPLVLWQCAGSDLVRISHVRVAGPMQGSYAPVEFDVRWSHSFRDSVNWDGAWIFVKYRVEKGPWQHATLSPASQHSTVGDDKGVPATIQPSQDGCSHVLVSLAGVALAPSTQSLLSQMTELPATSAFVAVVIS